MAKKIFAILAAGNCSLAVLGLLGKLGQVQTSALYRDSWRQVIALCAIGFAVSWPVVTLSVYEIVFGLSNAAKSAQVMSAANLAVTLYCDCPN